MKLKTVTVEFDMVIAVEEGQDAEKIARYNIRDAVRDMSHSDFGVNTHETLERNHLLACPC